MLLLHLSDLHFGSKNRFAKDNPGDLAKAFNLALLEACRQRDIPELKVDLVVVTGDITETGLPSQFRDAEQFLAKLAAEFGIPNERFVLVPGNHEICWASCRAVRADRDGEKFPATEFEERLQAGKLANYRFFLSQFYNTPVSENGIPSLEKVKELGSCSWARDFPDLQLSIAALNTSEREHDELKGGFLSKHQAQALMDHWRSDSANSALKIVALHHNPVSTTSANSAWTLDWLREREEVAKVPQPISIDAFQHYMADLSGFEGRELLQAVVKDSCAHLILHGHHHDQGDPIVWPWVKMDGGAPVLSVGSFGLSEDSLPGNAPLSCQLIRFDLQPNEGGPRLIALPLIYDGRFRLSGQVLSGAFRAEIESRSAYNQPLPMPPGWMSKELAQATPSTDSQAAAQARDPIPMPPELYAEPPYIGSHSFVGRASQLETLLDWAAPADSHPVLLYEAIGGSGKSMLTWEWVTKHSHHVRNDWAGRFWYSFYERGATMSDFCRRALAYMTSQARSKYKEKNTAELTQLLLHQLRDRPWLLVLDGVERVLVSYHRVDAAQLPDDQAGLVDKIADRDPCSAINPEDEDLLRAFAAAAPSKLLLTSRLIPRALLNRSGQPIPGVLRERLPGLRPTDAELLIRACGVNGDSAKIQAYLQTHCDCHPLVIGVLAGLITDYLPDKGNFDAWVVDPEGGGKLIFSQLDLVQKRNHILSTAFQALPARGHRLLSIIALLSESVDFSTLLALNPELPSIPERAEEPRNPENGSKWNKMTTEKQADARAVYLAATVRKAEFEQAKAAREEQITSAKPQLAETIKDLERRGLLQYDHISRRYDLHPVVRGIAAGGLKHEEKHHFGQRVVDHFSQQAHNPYQEAETIEEFDNAKRIVKALLLMGKEQEALKFINRNNVARVLASRFEAHNEILSIIRPFFDYDWAAPHHLLKNKGGHSIASIAAVALRRMGAFREAFSVSQSAIINCLDNKRFWSFHSHLVSLSSTAGDLNLLALEDRLLQLALENSALYQDDSLKCRVLLARYRQLSKLGMFREANSLWEEMSPLLALLAERDVADHHFALSQYFQGRLSADHLSEAEASNRFSAIGIRNLAALRGSWHLDRREYEAAKQDLARAVALAHKAGKVDRRSEVRLAIARYNLGELTDSRNTAEYFSQNAQGAWQYDLAELWCAIGNLGEAAQQATAAYQWAWADGEPFVNRYQLNKTMILLNQLGAPIPQLSPYKPDASRKLDLEEQVIQTINYRKSAKVISPPKRKMKSRSEHVRARN